MYYNLSDTKKILLKEKLLSPQIMVTSVGRDTVDPGRNQKRDLTSFELAEPLW